MTVMKRLRTWIRRTPAVSPAGFLVLAGVLTVSFLITDGMGLERYACVLSGSPPPEVISLETAAMYGAAYVLLYMAVVIVVPILTLGAAIFYFVQRLSDRRTPGSESGGDHEPTVAAAPDTNASPGASTSH
ncbi:MAG TPA: hypothetical protein P5081_24080 [Phycisphaerae bacterium]|nr:hypothetical protein [Phycisphaerae bacterium]HRW55965.1 hypothetical protein [Phycisphaerae bacterium]